MKNVICPLLTVVICSAVVSDLYAAEDTLPRGKVLQRVECAENREQTYSLYIPSSYTPDRKWPIIYALDAGAHGIIPVRSFSNAAEAYGCIIAGSNNSRNGPMERIIKAFSAVWKDTHARFSIDPNMIYGTGFSGGARAMFYFAFSGEYPISGVIACSGGFHSSRPKGTVPSFPVFSTAGTKDFNLAEMEMLNGFLREKKAPGRLRIFEGGHRWPSEYLCWEALEWMLIRAVRKEKTEAGILDRVWDNRTERARASEKKGNTFKAYKEHLFFARDFEGIRDTGEIRKKVEKLGALPDVQERLKQEEEKRKKREVYRKKVGETVNTICRLFNDDPEKTRSIIDELKGIIKKNEDEIEALYARAVLIQLAAHSRSGARYLVNKKYDEAIFHLKLALLVYPKEKSILYNIACAYSRKGDEQNGLRYLEKSVENGFTNIDHMERDPDLEPLRKTEGYKNVIKRLKKSG